MIIVKITQFIINFNIVVVYGREGYFFGVLQSKRPVTSLAHTSGEKIILCWYI